MGCCAVSHNKDGNFVIDFLTRNSETNRISVGRKTVNLDDIQREMKNSPNGTNLDIKNPEEMLKQQLSYRGVNLVDFQTFQGMVPQGLIMTPTKRRESVSPLHSSPRFLNPSSSKNISLIANKPPPYDPQELNHRKALAIMGNSSAKRTNKDQNGISLSSSISNNNANISSNSTAATSSLLHSVENRIIRKDSYRGIPESPAMNRGPMITNSRSPIRESSASPNTRLVHVISPVNSNNGSPMLPMRRVVYQTASPVNNSFSGRAEMHPFVIEPNGIQRSLSPVMPEIRAPINNLNSGIHNKIIAGRRSLTSNIVNGSPKILSDIEPRGNFHLNTSPLRLQAAAIPSNSYVFNQNPRDNSPITEVPLQEGPIRAQASPIGYHVAQHKLSFPNRMAEAQDVADNTFYNTTPFQGAPLVNSQVFDPEAGNGQPETIYQHVPMKYNAETIQKLSNKENLSKATEPPVPVNPRNSYAVVVDTRDKMVPLNNDKREEVKRGAASEEVPSTIDDKLRSRTPDAILRENTLEVNSSENDPSKQMKFPFNSVKPVTVKLLKPKESENKPNVFLQNKDGSPGRTIEMQLVKAVHVKAPPKELPKNSGLIPVAISQGAVKKDLPVTINEVEDESSKSVVHSEAYGSLSNNNENKNFNSQSKGGSNSSNSNNKNIDENVSLTVNLIGDSIKDNFVLQKISEILPDYIIPSFDKDRRKVKYVVPRAEIERNPHIQTLFQKIQGVQTMEKSNQSKNSKVPSESNTRPNISSSVSKSKQYMTESPKEGGDGNRKPGDSTTFANNTSQKRKDNEKTLFIEEVVQNNLNSSFPRGLLEDSPANKSISHHQRVDSPPRDKDEFREELLKSDREKDGYKYDKLRENTKSLIMNRDEVPSRNYNKMAFSEFERKGPSDDGNPYRKDRGTNKK